MINKEDIRLTDEEILPLLELRQSGGTWEMVNQISNTATDKAIRKMVEWFNGTCQHRVPFHTRQQCILCKDKFVMSLEKLMEEK